MTVLPGELGWVPCWGPLEHPAFALSGSPSPCIPPMVRQGQYEPSEGHPGPLQPRETPKGPLNATGCVLAHLLILSSLTRPSSFSLPFFPLSVRSSPSSSRVSSFTSLSPSFFVALLNFCLFGLSAGAGLDASSPRDSCQSPTSVFPSTLCRLKPASSSFPVIRIRIVNVSY